MFLSVSPGDSAQPLPRKTLPRLCVEAEVIFTLAAEAGSGGLIPIPFLNYDKVAQLLEHKLFKRPTSEVSFFHPSQSASTMAS